jgi:phosphatidylglycerophosphate synthase
VVRESRWVALPVLFTALTLVLTGLRIRIVRERASDWSGEGCVVGPYNPAERHYLYAITALLIISVASAIVVVIRTKSTPARITALVVIVVCALAALYLMTVWGGLEYNNQPHPELPCPNPTQRGD